MNALEMFRVALNGLVQFQQLHSIQIELFIQRDAPSLQANFCKMTHDRAGLMDHFIPAIPIGRSIPHQRSVATRHGINMYFCRAIGLWNDARETF